MEAANASASARRGVSCSMGHGLLFYFHDGVIIACFGGARLVHVRESDPTVWMTDDLLDRVRIEATTGERGRGTAQRAGKGERPTDG